MKRADLLSTAAAAALLLVTAASQAETVRCESSDGRYRSCPIDGRNGVSLSRQLSSQGCWQNDTWGFDLNRIWVDRGCRAEFRVGERSSGSSDKSNAVAGAIVLGLVGAAIIASNKNKDRDRYDDYRPGYGGNPRSTFRCESNNNRFTYCNAPNRGHLEVYRQLSSAPCDYGRSWGQERGRVWVSNGCRAEFAVY
ncbi:hypothetical protein DFR29_105195 [Tahibacter aquaticus]|uniref:DUF3011 family protein n=1 Tax=Tahibacter aquaticus TaxID=520092 RepID=A0A4R6Z0I5_9GAMM|nr:DUF3011 domain-containing protein [Tahibacter aquaticus]TDR45012.1 hypothetical protein DFR29_105195 [Tahibacter aquaticus]